MFDTEMQPVTFGILVFQTLILSAQLIIYIARPRDKKRLWFLLLTITYIFYNLASGLLPDERYSMNLVLQNIIAYASGISVAVYFIYYIYKEFEISPFTFFKVKYLFYTLTLSFIVLFITPYLITKDLSTARTLFLGIPVFISVTYLVQVTKSLIDIYKTKGKQSSRIFRFRIVAGNLGLLNLSFMPLIVVWGDYQTIEQSVVNFGFIIMMVAYIMDFVDQAKKETIILAQINKKESTSEIQMANELIDNILNELDQFEQNKDYLKGKVTLSILAKRFNTNSRYLSQVVNSYKNKSFTQYINDLRIDHFRKRMREDEKFRNYKVKAMAEEIGYSSTESFSLAFKKKTNKKLTEYIKRKRKGK